MPITPVGVGATANDGTGDSLRSLAQTVNLIIAAIGGVGSANPVVKYATAAALAANTYSAGVLTATANGALSVDGATPAVADRVLVKNEASPLKNGVYVVTTVGSAGAPYVLTRADDYDTWDEVAGTVVFVQQGTANAETAWQSSADAGGTLGTTSVPYVQVSSGTIAATQWGYLAAATAFGGPLLAAANLAAYVTALGGASAVRTAIATYSATEVDAAIAAETAALRAGVSASFDTLAEIATELALKATLASPALTGNPTAPTPSPGDNDTSIATTAFVTAAVAAVPTVGDGDKGDITVSASGATWTIDNDVVTYAKFQNASASNRILARFTASAGDFEEATLAADLSFSAGALRVGAFTGDITKTAGSLATTLAAAAISGKTAITAVDAAADYALMWDATDSALKKALAKYVGGVGREALFIEAPAFLPRPTTGCAALATLETTTNKVTAEYLAFDPSSAEYAHWRMVNPYRYGTNTFTYAVVWAHPATATNFGVVWGVSAGGFGNDDALDTALGTQITVTDTGGTTSDIYVSPESAALTVANLASLDFIVWELSRVAANGSDTLAVDAYFVGLLIYPTTIQNTDAP